MTTAPSEDRLLNVVRYRKQTYVLSEMSADELERLEVALVGDMAATRRKMDDLQMERLTYGITANPGEFRWLNQNRRIMSAQLEAVKRCRARARRRERTTDRPFQDLFMDVARELLPFELWDAIMKEVNQRRGGAASSDMEAN